MKVEFHTFLEFHSAAAGSPQSILHRMGNFISYTQKSIHKRHMQKLLPFSMCPVFSIPDNRKIVEHAFYCFRFRKFASL